MLTAAVGAGATAPTRRRRRHRAQPEAPTSPTSPPRWPGCGRGSRPIRRSARVDFEPGDPQHVDPTGRYLNVQVIGKERLRDAGEPRLRRPPAWRARPGGRLPGRRRRVVAGGGPPGGSDFLDLTYGWFPWLVAGRARCDLRPAAAGVPLAAPAAQGDHPQPALDRRRVRAARRRLQVGLGRAARADRATTRSRAGSR